MNLVQIAEKLKTEISPLRFRGAVTHIYNPLDYAWTPHRQYLERFGSGSREIVLLGMNPGPWGMAQTGVPFGDVPMVRDWMSIEAVVGKPTVEHPKRPVEGFACRRREVSGRRLWGWARDTYGPADRFFTRFFVANYCPLCFLEETGRNHTPDKLAAAERSRLFEICDAALAEAMGYLRPRCVVGIGRFAEARAVHALRDTGIGIGAAPHPSPANPAANRNWARQMDSALAALGIRVP